jgi:sortase A
MAYLIATAAIVLLVAALSVYGPVARQGAPGARARAATPAPVPVPLPQGGRDPVSRLVGPLRTRAWARMALTTVSVGLLVGAVGTIGYPFYTNLLQDRIQSRLNHQFASPELLQAYKDRNVQIGDSLTRIKIPAINVDVVVVEGTTASALRAGAGHYPETPLPCEIGNVAIAGHRTTYGRPFNHLDLLKPGDKVTLQTPIGECTYQITTMPFAVSPKDVDVVANTPSQPTLTLTTCHPKGSAAQRLVVKATMVQSSVRNTS